MSFEPFEKAFYLLFKAWLIYACYSVARKVAMEGSVPKWKAFGWSIFLSGGLAFLAWGAYGTHTENEDFLMGGGDTVVDFVPSNKERNEHGLFLFTVLLIPMLLGVSDGFNDRPTKRS